MNEQLSISIWLRLDGEIGLVGFKAAGIREGIGKDSWSSRGPRKAGVGGTDNGLHRPGTEVGVQSSSCC